MKTLEFSTPVLVRAEVVRVVGSHNKAGFAFRQKPLDQRRFAPHSFEATESWPGAPVPETWATTPDEWPLEPTPNGQAVLRARRIVFPTPQVGIVLGQTHLAEGTVITGGNGRGGRTNQLADKRWIDFYEVALPSTGRGRTHLTLVHSKDLTVLPLGVTQLAST